MGINAYVELLAGRQGLKDVWLVDGKLVEAPVAADEAAIARNMKAINAAQGALANGQNIFYIDGNPLFADANGDLSMEHSGDGCHLSKKACKTYAAWVIEQTKSLLGL